MLNKESEVEECDATKMPPRIKAGIIKIIINKKEN